MKEPKGKGDTTKHSDVSLVYHFVCGMQLFVILIMWWVWWYYIPTVFDLFPNKALFTRIYKSFGTIHIIGTPD